MFHNNFLSTLLTVCSWAALSAPASVSAAAPTFTAFSPASGKLGTTVTIHGSHFVAGATSVFFDGVTTASVKVLSSTELTAGVPLTASTGRITLKTNGGSVTGGSPFTVVPGLVTSTIGAPTSSHSLYYSGFGSYEAIDFYFDTENFALTSVSSTGAGNLAVTIPRDAAPGTHWLTAVGQHSGYSAQIAFLVRADYPMYGFSANHQANNILENVLDKATVPKLREAWRTLMIGYTICVPAIAGGVVYATFGDGTIRAFDEISGTQKWSFQTDGFLMRCSPAVSGGVLYVGSGDHFLYALDAGTGAQKWCYQTGSDVGRAPTVSGGRVYFGSLDHKVYALNAATGALVWNYTTGDVVTSSPAVAKGVVYVGSNDHSLYALDAGTGALRWQYATGGSINASAVLVGGLVCFGSDDHQMRCLRASTGDLVWSYPTNSSIAGLPAVEGNTLFFGSQDGKIYAVTADGLLRWATAVRSGTYVAGQVCTANGVVYASTAGYTYALAADSGAILAVLPVGSAFGGLAVVNGAVLVGDSSDGVLTRYLPNAVQLNFAAERPEPSRLVPRPLP